MLCSEELLNLVPEELPKALAGSLGELFQLVPTTMTFLRSRYVSLITQAVSENCHAIARAMPKTSADTRTAGKSTSLDQLDLRHQQLMNGWISVSTVIGMMSV